MAATNDSSSTATTATAAANVSEGGGGARGNVNDGNVAMAQLEPSSAAAVTTDSTATATAKEREMERRGQLQGKMMMKKKKVRESTIGGVKVKGRRSVFIESFPPFQAAGPYVSHLTVQRPGFGNEKGEGSDGEEELEEDSEEEEKDDDDDDEPVYSLPPGARIPPPSEQDKLHPAKSASASASDPATTTPPKGKEIKVKSEEKLESTTFFTPHLWRQRREKCLEALATPLPTSASALDFDQSSPRSKENINLTTKKQGFVMSEEARLEDERSIKSVLDIGCGEAALLQVLLNSTQFIKLAGLDISFQDLVKARANCEPSDRDFSDLREVGVLLELFQGSLDVLDERLKGFDAITLLEVIEHLDPEVLEALPAAVFGYCKPKKVIISTPNSEFNVNFPGLVESGKFRHWDHRFEFTREEFKTWVQEKVCDVYQDYILTEFSGVGVLKEDYREDHGFASQFAILERIGPLPSTASTTQCCSPLVVDPVLSVGQPHSLFYSVDFPFFEEIYSKEEMVEKIVVFLRDGELGEHGFSFNVLEELGEVILPSSKAEVSTNSEVSDAKVSDVFKDKEAIDLKDAELESLSNTTNTSYSTDTPASLLESEVEEPPIMRRLKISFSITQLWRESYQVRQIAKYFWCFKELFKSRVDLFTIFSDNEGEEIVIVKGFECLVEKAREPLPYTDKDDIILHKEVDEEEEIWGQDFEKQDVYDWGNTAVFGDLPFENALKPIHADRVYDLQLEAAAKLAEQETLTN